MTIQWKCIYQIGILAGSIALVLSILACGDSSTEPTVGTTKTSASADVSTPVAVNPTDISTSADASTPEAVETTHKDMPQADMDILRSLTFDYWDALNSYDVEKTLSYLEENYRQVHADEVKDGIAQMKQFGVKLEASEESSPRATGQDQAEMYVTLKEPVGTRRILMEFAKIVGEWKITFAEEVE